MRIQQLEHRAPGADDVRIRVAVAGVSFVDVLVTEGAYQVKPPLPFVPGSEFAGVIDAVGPNVSSGRIGERVCASAFGGAFADEAIVPAAGAISIPNEMTFEQASVFPVSYFTAYHALIHRASLRAGETLCVLGAAGAVGYASVQIGQALGARVIACASDATKRAFILAGGADYAIDSGAPDWREQIMVLTERRGLDVIVDPIGGRLSELALRCAAWNGRHLIVGFATGDIPKIATSMPLLKGASLIGVETRQFGIRQPQKAAEVMPALINMYRRGDLAPAVAAAYPLEAFASAMNEARRGKLAGRIVLRMS
jgi:NADPH:quinone reductase